MLEFELFIFVLVFVLFELFIDSETFSDVLKKNLLSQIAIHYKKVFAIHEEILKAHHYSSKHSLLVVKREWTN